MNRRFRWGMLESAAWFSNTNSAPAMSREPLAAILRQATTEQRAKRLRRVPPAAHSSPAPALSTVASVSLMSSPSNARWPVNISKSTQPNAHTSLRLSAGSPLRLLGAHVGGRAEDHPAWVIAGLVMVGDMDTVGSRTARCAVRLQARAPSPVRSPAPSPCHRSDLDIRRLQVAMDDALLVRGLERFGDLWRDRQRVIDGNRPLPMRSASVGPSTSSITSATTPPIARDRRSRRCSGD